MGTSAPALPGRETSHTPTRAVALGGGSLAVRRHRPQEQACCGHLWRRTQALQPGGHHASPCLSGVISFIACPISAACKRQLGAPAGWEAEHTERPRWPAAAGTKRVLEEGLPQGTDADVSRLAVTRVPSTPSWDSSLRRGHVV